jgi:hypothetical protein
VQKDFLLAFIVAQIMTGHRRKFCDPATLRTKGHRVVDAAVLEGIKLVLGR